MPEAELDESDVAAKTDIWEKMHVFRHFLLRRLNTIESFNRHMWATGVSGVKDSIVSYRYTIFSLAILYSLYRSRSALTAENIKYALVRYLGTQGMTHALHLLADSDLQPDVTTCQSEAILPETEVEKSSVSAEVPDVDQQMVPRTQHIINSAQALTLGILGADPALIAVEVGKATVGAFGASKSSVETSRSEPSPETEKEASPAPVAVHNTDKQVIPKIRPNGLSERLVNVVARQSARYFMLFDQNLPTHIRNFPNLYAPIISALVGQSIGLGGVLAQQTISTALYFLLKDHSAVPLSQIKQLATAGFQAMQLEQADYIAAHNAFRQARQICVDMHLEYDQRLSDQYQLLCYQDALALFYLGRLDKPVVNNVYSVLEEAMRYTTVKPEVLNLYGMLLLMKGRSDQALAKFSKSMAINPAQTDIFVLQAYCRAEYQAVASYDIADYHNTSTYKDLIWFVPLYFHSECLKEYSKTLVNPDSRRPYLIKANELSLKSLEEVPQNPRFKTFCIQIVEQRFEIGFALLDVEYARASKRRSNSMASSKEPSSSAEATVVLSESMQTLFKELCASFEKYFTELGEPEKWYQKFLGYANLPSEISDQLLNFEQDFEALSLS